MTLSISTLAVTIGSGSHLTGVKRKLLFVVLLMSGLPW